jgi:hypothetical protein
VAFFFFSVAGSVSGERSSLALRLASVCTRQHHKRTSLEFNVSSLQAWHQILRLGVTLLNHQNRMAATQHETEEDWDEGTWRRGAKLGCETGRGNQAAPSAPVASA